MSTTSELKVLHDRLLEQKPPEVEHESAACVLCAMEDDTTTRGGSMPESFTQEQVDALIADAVKTAATDLQKRLDELEAQVQQTEVGQAVADAVAPKDEAIAELQSKLDAAEAARTAAETKLTELTDAIAAAEQAQELARLREERVAQAKELKVFSDEYVAENAERFAAMSDEDFAARVAEWQLIAASHDKTKSQIPAATALQASRADAATTTGSSLSLITEMRERRLDPRTL